MSGICYHDAVTFAYGSNVAALFPFGGLPQCSGSTMMSISNPFITGCVEHVLGHGQYLVYRGSKSSIFEECLIVFQVLGI